jgi:hypothetical protein
LLAVILTGCTPSSGDRLRGLERAESFDLYSLEPFTNPDTYEMDQDPNGPGERLHGWRVLGKTTVADAATRGAVLTALKEAMERKGMDAKCHYPRHAIRWQHYGKTFDLLICFECGNYQIYRDGQRTPGSPPISGSAESAFDNALKQAGIPLAKKPARKGP